MPSCPATPPSRATPTCASSTSSARPCSAPTSTRPAEDATAGADPRRGRRGHRTTRCPADPYEQLAAAIRAVFGSWSSRRAVAYRKHWGIPEDGGTAVVVQAMVFGNLGRALRHRASCSAATRSRGDPEPYGEWLPGGQGEDVVSGTHDPLPLAALAGQTARGTRRSCSRPRACSSARTATCRTSSSRSRRPALPAPGPLGQALRRWPPCAPPWTSPPRARSTALSGALAGSAPSSSPTVLAPRSAESVSARAPRCSRAASPPARAWPPAGSCRLRRGRGGRGRRGPGPPDDEPRGRAAAMIAARARGHRARRLHLARRRGHPRARTARAWSAWARA